MYSIKIPWQVKILLKILLTKFTVSYSFRQYLGVFRHGRMDDAEYAIRIFDSHVRRAEIRDLKNKQLMELGPGDSISTAIIAATHGANAVLVDAGSFARNDLRPYRELVAALKTKGFEPPDLDRCTSIEDILLKCGAKYLTGGVESIASIQTESIDFIFSEAVLEHVRKSDFLNLTQECKRVLKPSGFCSHRVDLRDHLDNGLNNLRFSEIVWESSLFSKSGFYTNRIRFSQMIKIFTDNKFQIHLCETEYWEKFPMDRSKLHEDFAFFEDDDLKIKAFNVLISRT